MERMLERNQKKRVFGVEVFANADGMLNLSPPLLASLLAHCFCGIDMQLDDADSWLAQAMPTCKRLCMPGYHDRPVR